MNPSGLCLELRTDRIKLAMRASADLLRHIVDFRRQFSRCGNKLFLRQAKPREHLLLQSHVDKERTFMVSCIAFGKTVMKTFCFAAMLYIPPSYS